MTVTIYHNPRCSKSRATLTLLEERGLDPVVIDYQQTPPDVATLRDIAAQLDAPVRALVRDNEDIYQELKLDNPALSDTQLFTAITQHPILLQRPIVIANGKARIGRPPEAVLEIL